MASRRGSPAARMGRDVGELVAKLWRRRRTGTVQVSTKLNRSHVVHGKRALILPCLSRTERDRQRGGLQGVSVEDSMAMVHMSFGMKRPGSPHLKSEPAIGRAEFSAAPPHDVCPAPGRLTLGTMRSHDQFNTTIYCNDDRYRGVETLRTLVFMNPDDMRERALAELDLVDIPRGNAAGYMPELNVLCALGDFSAQSDQPLTKHLVVEIARSAPVTPPRRQA